MVAAVVDFIGLKGECLCRTRNHTQVAALAPLDVDGDSTSYFCHIVELLLIARSLGSLGHYDFSGIDVMGANIPKNIYIV